MTKHILRIVVIAVIVVSGVGLFTQKPTSTPSAVLGASTTSGSLSACEPISVASLISPVSGQLLTSTTILTVYGSTFYKLASVTFFVDGSNIATAVQTTPAQWQVTSWDANSSNFSNGNHQFWAVVGYSSTTSGTTSTQQLCQTTPISVAIQKPASTTVSGLEAVVAPLQWVGPTNLSAPPFVVNVNMVTTTGIRSDVTALASYTWTTTIGIITPHNQGITLFSGPTAGKGTTSVTIAYSGFTKTLTIPIEVQAYNPNSTYPTPTNTTTTTLPGTKPITTATQGDSELEKCIKTIIGDARYKEIISGSSRLTFEEVQQTKLCFATRQNIIPPALAPIVPSKAELAKLPEDKKRLAVLDIQTLQNDDKKAITFSGKATPNKTVLLYIFSEPLVLTTNTDGDGKWSYVLEDPLEPGSHEAYVAVDTGGGNVVRSSAFAFAIDTGTKSDSNPGGLSYIVSDRTNPATADKLYIAVALLVVLLAGFILVVIVKRRKPTPTDPEQPTSSL